MKKVLSLLLAISMSVLLFVHFPPKAFAGPADFITTWTTNTPSESITIPTSGIGYNYDVDWGDASNTLGATGDTSHTYLFPGTYTVTISGTFPRIAFPDSGDHPQLSSVEQWGSNVWTSMDHAFWGAINLVVHATDTPDLSAVTSTAFMFHNTASITTIENINTWDVSHVTDMHNMFSLSTFNGEMSNWDTSAVTNMSGMFYGNESFNQDISNWDVSNVTDMHDMFSIASVFNQDLSSWDVSSVTNMDHAFDYATAFNQSLGAWDVSSAITMVDMLSHTNIEVENYDATLRGWADRTLHSSVVFGASNLQYCGSHESRANIISTYTWVITDDGIAAATCLFTEPPTLSAPIAFSSHSNSGPLTISFSLPENPLAGSIRLNLTPAVGLPTVLSLRDAAPTVVNTFSLPLNGDFGSTTEIISYTGPSLIATGTYTVSLSYRDYTGNSPIAASATNVTITPPASTEGTLRFHIFNDTNGNGSQNAGEDDNYTGATLTISGSVADDEIVSFDDHGDIDSAIEAGTYVLSVNNPSGTRVTGGSNHILVTITAEHTTDAGSRGITTSNSSGSRSGGSSSGRVSYGSSSSTRGSSTTYSGSSSSSNSSHSSSSSNNSGTSDTTQPTTTYLPIPPPHEPACLHRGNNVNFTDGANSSDIAFLGSLIFANDASRHLIHGYNDGTFGGEHFLTRFELLKIALGSNCVGSGNSNIFTHNNTHFSDVPHDDSEQSKIIGEAYHRGIITGIGDQFFPNKPVTYAEFIKILFTSSAYFNLGQPLNTLEINVANIPDPTFAQPLEYARRLGILPSTFDPNAAVSRHAMAQLLAQYIQAMRGTVMTS